MSEAVMNQGERRAKRSIIPWLFVGFFGVVFLVNGIMVWFAVTTFSGIETEKAFQKGLDYNDTLAAEARQEVLGWQAAIALEPYRLAITLNDRHGTTLAPEAVAARLVRPADSDLDRLVTLEPAGDGEFRTLLDPLPSGLWEVRAQIDHQGERFFATERIIIP